MRHVVEKRQTSRRMPSRSFKRHFGLGAHQIPLEMLEASSSGVEERAAATVPDERSATPHKRRSCNSGICQRCTARSLGIDSAHSGQ